MKKMYKQPKSATMTQAPKGELSTPKVAKTKQMDTSKAKPNTSSSKMDCCKRGNHPGAMAMIPKGM